MRQITDIIQDYHALTRRIDIEYQIRMKGGLEEDVHQEWQEQGIGHSHLNTQDLRTTSAILAILRHPIKSHICMILHHIENNSRSYTE